MNMAQERISLNRGASQKQSRISIVMESLVKVRWHSTLGFWRILAPVSGKAATVMRLALVLVFGFVSLSGCARHYVIKTASGHQIDAFGRPKLTEGTYHYKDGSGRKSAISASRVLEIEPASLVKEEEKETTKRFQPKKPKHWYFLWLASATRTTHLAGTPS
jgi:hypothetical protein